MSKGIRTVIRDETLCVTAYRFEGIVQPFPSHFHEHYVIGLVEKGERKLVCRGETHCIHGGDVLIFNPGESHACEQSDEETLHYRALEIPWQTMRGWTEEIAGMCEPPSFQPNVLRDEEAACCLRTLHGMIMESGAEMEKEEQLLLLITLLMERCFCFLRAVPQPCGKEVERACAFMRQHVAEHVTLGKICRHTGLSKSTLLRIFTQAKGISPYRYLETVRMNEARRLLEQGVTPVDTAMRLGFADQSHFTNHFNRFFGVTPGMYGGIFSIQAGEGGTADEE